jgi:hypothetical protein
MDKMRILINMGSFFRKLDKLLLVLIMIGLPLQGALAAIMPLCAQAAHVLDIGAQPETMAHSATPTACSKHDIGSQAQPAANEGGSDNAGFALSCDGVVCHISGNGLPPAASTLNPSRGLSYAVSFNPRFTSSILPQPQRPPLA